MKLNTLVALVCLAIALPACKKNTEKPPQHVPPERSVQYFVYTSQDYSNNNTYVTIKLRMLAGNTPIWDSVLAPMQLKNIPGPSNKLIFEKKVPGNNPAELSTGFYYSIENVGDSWYYELFKPGSESLKTVSLHL